MIPLAEPNLTGNESQYLQDCLASNFVSSVGAFVNRFEDEFAAFVESPRAVATTNGTSAIHMALILAGVGPGDEVWVSDFTFIASANPIRYLQARPVLVDSEARTWNMDPALVVEALEARARTGKAMPKAILAVHILGFPADIGPIAQACEKYGIWLIEDAAEALGASYVDGPYRGRQVGTIGHIGCYSFNGNKIITTGGGGMLVSEDPVLMARAKHLTTQAKLPGLAYDHDEVGYNYRLTNLQAALGVAQLERLADFISKKREVAARYDASFAGLPGLRLAPHPAGTAPTFWLYSLGFEAGWEAPQKTLESDGIFCRPLWTPLHRMATYRDCQLIGSGAVAEDLAGHWLSLPCSTSLTEVQQDEVIGAVRRFLQA